MSAYVFRISLDCPHCRAGVPVNGFSEEVLCSNCLRSIPLGLDWWKEHLDRETLRAAMRCEPGTANTVSSLGGMNEKVDSGNRMPRCQDCKTEFEQADIIAASEVGGLNCKGCKAYVSVRKATPLALQLIPEAEFLVNESGLGNDLAGDKSAIADPVLFACMACGGTLDVDGKDRAPKCQHCGRSNYLPDALWLRLHPAPVSHPYFVTRKKGNSTHSNSKVEKPEKQSEDSAVEYLSQKSLDSNAIRSAYEQFKDNQEACLAMARHRNCPEDIQSLLCIHHNEEVREAIATRPNLPTSVIEKLAQDKSKDVRKALSKKRESYLVGEQHVRAMLNNLDLKDLGKAIVIQGFPEWKLLELSRNSTHYDAQKILTAHNASVAVLKALGSNPESHKFIKQHPTYQALPWWRKVFFFG